MSFKTIYVIATFMSATLAGCTKSGRSVEVVPQKAPATTVQPTVGNDTAEIPVTLKEADLKPYGDTANMKYKFSYLTVLQEKDVVFANGTAQISITSLPAGQTGTVVLEIYEGATVKLRGVSDNVTLQKGVNNNLKLNLTKADGTGAVNPGAGGSGTTDLTIDVSLDNGQGGGTPPPGTGPGGGGAGTTDPIASWDGKSFKGNAKWTIVPVGT